MSIRELRFNVAGEPGTDVPTLQPDLPPGHPPIFGTFEQPGRMLMVIPDEVYGGSTVSYQHEQKTFRVIVPPNQEGQWEAGDPLCLPPEYHGDPDKVALHYTPIVKLSPLEVRGRYFWKDGQRFFLNGATAFNAPGRFASEGPDPLRPVFAQRQGLFNCARFFSAYNIPGIGRCIPREISGFYDQIVPGVSLLAAEYGQYPYWTVYAGADSVTLGTRDQMIEHQHRMEDALGPLGFCLLDLHNEKDNPANDPSDFTGPNPPNTLLWSQGSNIQDVDPPTPYGRFAARHPGSSEWQRKVGKQAWDFQQGNGITFPVVDDETVRCEPTGETNRQHAHDAGACGALFIAGAFYHSAQAKRFDLLTGSELDTADGWCEGVRSIEAQGLDIAQEGQYSRPEDPNYLRVYMKTLGSRAIRLEIDA